MKVWVETIHIMISKIQIFCELFKRGWFAGLICDQISFISIISNIWWYPLKLIEIVWSLAKPRELEKLRINLQKSWWLDRSLRGECFGLVWPSSTRNLWLLISVFQICSFGKWKIVMLSNNICMRVNADYFLKSEHYNPDDKCPTGAFPTFHVQLNKQKSTIICILAPALIQNELLKRAQRLAVPCQFSK